MRRKIPNLLYNFALLLVLSACAGAAGTSSSGAAGTKTDTTTGTAKAEDLSKYRPKYTLPETANASVMPAAKAGAAVMPTNHVNQQVAMLLDSVAIKNKSVRYAKGFRIQAYSGTERKAAMDVRNAIVRRLPDEEVYQQYKQPTWRIKVGDYFSRIEAQQALLRIRDITPNALIVVDQINVK